MFNFFKKPEENHQDRILASIRYIIKENHDGALVDVELNDYDEESIESLCSLLELLGNDNFYFDTINTIKSSLIRDHQEEVFIKIFTKINDQVKQKILNSHKEKISDQPCIKPSEMLDRYR